VTPSCVVVG